MSFEPLAILLTLAGLIVYAIITAEVGTKNHKPRVYTTNEEPATAQEEAQAWRTANNVPAPIKRINTRSPRNW